jgi:hypothetical protein
MVRNLFRQHAPMVQTWIRLQVAKEAAARRLKGGEDAQTDTVTCTLSRMKEITPVDMNSCKKIEGT